MILRRFLPALLAFACAVAIAQQYRWTDAKGEVHYSDTPPPGAKNVQKRNLRGSVVETPPPFELQRVQKDFPVTLYTSPNCKEPCAMAREALNRRGVPFDEVQVWEEESNEKLKKATGANEVPALVVGRTAHRGFEQGAYDSLLDSAGYPKAGALPARSQGAPQPPEGYVSPEAREKPAAEPVVPGPEPAPGPYSPGAPPQRPQK